MSAQGYNGLVLPFVVTVNNSRIYVGEFYSNLSSVGFSKDIYVYSQLEPYSEQNENLVQLYDYSDKGLIHDKRIYNVLKDYGILKE